MIEDVMAPLSPKIISFTSPFEVALLILVLPIPTMVPMKELSVMERLARDIAEDKLFDITERASPVFFGISYNQYMNSKP